MQDMDLQYGKDIYTLNGIKIKHPSLNDIREFGEDLYLKSCSLFTVTPYDYMVELEDSGIDFLDLTNYDLFLEMFKLDESKEFIKFFLGEYNFRLAQNTVNQDIVLYDKEKDVVIDRLIYEEISVFIKRINMIPLNPPYDIENLKSKPFLTNMILEDMRAKRERQKYKKKINTQSELSNLIRFLIWNNRVGYTYDSIWGLKVYQFYEGIMSLQKTDNYKNIMLGLYTGNIDAKKTNLDESSWISKIKIT